MAFEMEEIRGFLVEATQELLYNIVFSNEESELLLEEMDYRVLSEEFEEKVGYKPMDFFGFGNITGRGWLEFLRSCPGLSLHRRNISINTHDYTPYGEYNTTFLPGSSVADYREKLLIKACDGIVEGHGSINVNANHFFGDTALHLVAAMPGVVDDEPTLVRHLLKAGADPLETNNEELNILHIIAGRIKAEVDEDGDIFFTRQHINDIWETGHRQRFLDVLSEEVSPACLATLMSQPGRDGNTVMHEWVLSTSTVNLLKSPVVYPPECNLVEKHIEIASKLLSFGGNLRIPNESGLLPLHFANHSSVFKFLQNGAVCRARNYHDETPLLYILKHIVGLAFINTTAAQEIRGYLDARFTEGSLEKSVLVLEHLIKSVTQNEELTKTIWIPDMEEVFALEYVLVSIRVASYNSVGLSFPFSQSDLPRLAQLRSSLVVLLNQILRRGNRDRLKRRNKKGQTPLHVLLDMSSSNMNIIVLSDEILQSLTVLLQNGADVNALDAKGKTVLDVMYKYAKKMPSLVEKCEEILRSNGAKRGSRPEVDSAVHQQLQAISTLTIGNAKRKLRSCPKRHSDTALKLSKATTDVTAVQRYRYFSHKPVGTGAFSSIYVAIKDEHVDKKSGTIDCRAIALKRLEKAKVNPQEIEREVKALLSISNGCENILNCYESFEDEFFHYLSLDLMDGDLRQFIEDSTAKLMMQGSPTSPARAAQGIINGLVYLHEKNFLHRDLKPGNILYTVEPSLHFKIGDFGSAKNISTSSTMMSTKGDAVGMAPGTRCWMAPELVSLRSREHTKESDVFALGLVLHFLLTFGEHPFVGATEEPAHVIEKKIQDLQISLHASLSSEAQSFLQVMLTKDPKRRPPAKYLTQHPFLWSEKKKIEFLKAVGDQLEAVNPSKFPNSDLEKFLQDTSIARKAVSRELGWVSEVPELFIEMNEAWKPKKYRIDKVIDLVRFLRNAYAHKEERSPKMKSQLDNNIFLRKFPSLVLEVFGAIQKAGYEESRSNIRQALTMT